MHEIASDDEILRRHFAKEQCPVCKSAGMYYPGGQPEPEPCPECERLGEMLSAIDRDKNGPREEVDYGDGIPF
ncbi:hypothetical protein SAMN05216452_3198 [Nitratireductor aquibiodomus]|uniref:Uncharacterized protein n=1 Tax=Nitratireductor aquibiodomus TaxID=204799 RepID=A0A1H4MA21_9HYPH|nr:hypothetical protein [Nitratireductor aquibiodomus]SEB79345.1 hypothetical protein SAMN05216452_3198 [Nitratireductor aquibiodomus]